MKAKIIVGALALTLISSPVFAEETLYCQGMVCSTTPPDASKFANFDVKDEAGNTVTTIWGSTDYYGQPSVKTENNNATCSSCSFVAQPIPVITPFVPVISETTTALIDSATALIDTATVVTDTATATVTIDTIQTLYAKLMVLFNQITAILAKLNG